LNRREKTGTVKKEGLMDLYEALYTTRAMRRLKPDPIPDEVQARLLDEAIRAPNIEQGWRFLLVDDAQIKAQLAPLYLQAFERQVGAPLEEAAPTCGSADTPMGRTVRSGGYLAHHFAEVPKAFRNPVFWGRTAVRTLLRAPLAPPQGDLRAGHSRIVQPSQTPKRRRNRGARPYHGRVEGSGIWCVFGAWSGNSVKEVG
jgi:nitroreductase